MSLDQDTIVRALFRERVKLSGYIWGIVRDSHLAEDVFQDVCISAIKSRDQIDDEQHLLAWSRRVARHRAIDLLRKHERTPLLLDNSVLEMIEAAWSVDDHVPSTDRLDALRFCLGKLTANNQRIVKLRYVDGLRGTEVAEALGRKVDAVYKALSRIHVSLVECGRRRLGRTRGGDSDV